MFFDPDFPDQEALKSIVRRHGQILFQPFDQEGLRVESLHLEVDPMAQFRMQPCRFIRSDILVPLKALIDQFVSEGVLVSDISCTHASPLVIVHKKEGGIRMAVDYREVNQYLRVSANQLPYQDMLFQQLAGMQYFAKVDNLWGYHQLRLDKESSRVTAIITPWGVYRFLACPFGISTAPGEYQARMAHKVLEGYYLNGAVVYIDDTVVYGKDASSFLKMLYMVLTRMANFNVRLKPSKCSFGMTSVEFLGHIFDEHGVHLSEKRVQGIQDLPIPTSVSAVRSFVGMVNYFRDFIKGLSSHLIPLTRVYAQLYGFEFYTVYDYNRIRFASYVFCVHAQIYPKFKLRFPGIST